MKVYLIAVDYEGCREYVFSTREKAQIHISMYMSGTGAEVIEVEVQ